MDIQKIVEVSKKIFERTVRGKANWLKVDMTTLTDEQWQDEDWLLRVRLMEGRPVGRMVFLDLDHDRASAEHIFLSIPVEVFQKALYPNPIEALAAINERPRVDMRYELEQIAQKVHQAYHQDIEGSHRECPRGVCQRVRSLLDECPRGDDMESTHSSIPHHQSTGVPMACAKCGVSMSGGTYVGGAGPYCPHCVPGQAPQGWICPKCQGANSPDVKRCPCSPLGPQILTEG